MSWLVTGAGGFLGQALTAAIRRAEPGAEIIAADLGPVPEAPGITPARLDVADPAAVMALVARHRPARILHAAALTPGPAADAGLLLKTLHVNLGGTLNMIRAALAHRPEHLLLVSSAGVYPDGDGSFTEDGPLAPVAAYAASKLAAETAAASFGADLGLTVVRPGPLYGPTEIWRPSRPSLSLFALMAHAAREGRPFALGAPGNARDWMHSDDAARAIVALAARPAPIGVETFNVASGARVDHARLARAFAPFGLVTEIAADPHPAEASRPALSVARLRAATGLTPRSIEDGVADLMARAPAF